MQFLKDWHHLRLFLKLTIYYVVIAVGIWFAYTNIPDLTRHLPLGVVENMINEDGGITDFKDIEIYASGVTSEFGGVLWLIVAILGAVALMIPVSWVYMAIREVSKVDQSLVETMIILPAAVTGIVLIVQNSIPLAFALTGVVAGVRFRNTLKSPADSVFIFMSVGVGLAAGIGMLMIALIMTVIFNYVFALLWALNYGYVEEAKTYMRLSKEEKEDEDRGIFD
ncbi:MAG: hypothetical protein R3348_09000 [Xanthomonadales bacterium]|nr:hypothetical protein [Xanthomonadales bacterium]